ncbi:conserved hypothetical protein [Escherichia albertii TW07627]|uniref:Uncharacterized protein n=1 Tax=Escherichia albertii (strain TW07627) TaxID=502347 RepID=A0ABC9NUH4_ESCAT|nr:conserved hypothetical protein [Escherichia albertii TW07627]
MNALYNLQNTVHSIYCKDRVGQISVAHLAILRLLSVSTHLHST